MLNWWLIFLATLTLFLKGCFEILLGFSFSVSRWKAHKQLSEKSRRKFRRKSLFLEKPDERKTMILAFATRHLCQALYCTHKEEVFPFGKTCYMTRELNCIRNIASESNSGNGKSFWLFFLSRLVSWAMSIFARCGVQESSFLWLFAPNQNAILVVNKRNVTRKSNTDTQLWQILI